MRWGILCALFIGALALSQQTYGKDAAGQHGHKQAATAVAKPANKPPSTQQPTGGCPGSYHPEINCAAISADADVDQASNAENQTWWFRWEVGLTFLTLLVATGAMIFAERAAFHTNRSANAARDTADLTVAQGSADVRIQHVQLSIPAQPGNFGQQQLFVNAKNVGHTEARDVHPRVWISSSDGRFDRLEMEVAENYPTVTDIGHNGSSQGFPFTHPTFVFEEQDVRSGTYNNVMFTAEVSWEFKTILGKAVAQNGVWEGTMIGHISENGTFHRQTADLARRE
jgi:hypothetical protein